MRTHKLRKKNSPQKSPATPAPPSRLPWLDALRGIAVLAMIAYHFGFDLNHLGWLHQDINHDPRWLTARALILGSFLFCVGAGQALASQQKHSTRWLRIGKITLAALLVSAGSWLMFPQTFIWFGVLHAIAVMSLLMLLLQRLKPGPVTSGLLSIAALGLGNLYHHSLFDHPALGWIGLMSTPPNTEDYVPLLPWFGLCLAGYAFMSWQQSSPPHPTDRPPPRWLSTIGRNSLPIYLLHQPVLLGILIPATRLLRTPG